jgi:hypothetical protein
MTEDNAQTKPRNFQERPISYWLNFTTLKDDFIDADIFKEFPALCQSLMYFALPTPIARFINISIYNGVSATKETIQRFQNLKRYGYFMPAKLGWSGNQYIEEQAYKSLLLYRDQYFGVDGKESRLSDFCPVPTWLYLDEIKDILDKLAVKMIELQKTGCKLSPTESSFIELSSKISNSKVLDQPLNSVKIIMEMLNNAEEKKRELLNKFLHNQWKEIVDNMIFGLGTKSSNLEWEILFQNESFTNPSSEEEQYEKEKQQKLATIWKAQAKAKKDLGRYWQEIWI